MKVRDEEIEPGQFGEERPVYDYQTIRLICSTVLGLGALAAYSFTVYIHPEITVAVLWTAIAVLATCLAIIFLR